jgi:ribonuclease III
MAGAGDDKHAALLERLGLEGPLPQLATALTHPSYSNEQPEYHDNQRLEFLGDAVFGLCVSELLMASFDGVDEGELTLMRASLVNAGALAAIARDVALSSYLRVGRGADAAGERHRDNVLADALEAVMGAVYVDRGLAACRELSSRLLGDAVARLVASGGIQRDAKSRLQELVQAHGGEPPEYHIVATEGPPHARRFTVSVTVALREESIVREGEGRSKKLAEQAAAGAALAHFDDLGSV